MINKYAACTDKYYFFLYYFFTYLFVCSTCTIEHLRHSFKVRDLMPLMHRSGGSDRTKNRLVCQKVALKSISFTLRSLFKCGPCLMFKPFKSKEWLFNGRHFCWHAWILRRVSQVHEFTRYYPPPFILSSWERRHGNVNKFFLFGTPNHYVVINDACAERMIVKS